MNQVTIIGPTCSEHTHHVHINCLVIRAHELSGHTCAYTSVLSSLYFSD